MKLAWFSPLPKGSPTSKGEGDWLQPYWHHVLPALCEQAEVTVFTDQDHRPQWIDRSVEVQPICQSDSFWRRVQSHDLAIYHLADRPGPFAKAFDMLQMHAGLVVLHEASIHYLVAVIWSLFRNRPQAYLETVRRYGDEADVAAAKTWAAEDFRRAKMPQNLPLLAYLTESALALVTHSPTVHNRLPATFGLPTACLGLPFDAPTPTGPAVEPNPRQRGFEIWLCTDGRLGVFPVLEALVGHAVGNHLKLVISAPKKQHPHLRRAIRELSLVSTTELTHQSPAERLKDSAPHFLIDFRPLAHQEHLYQLLPIWRRGVVVGVPWSLDDPLCRRGDVLAIRPRHALKDTVRHLNWLHGSPESFLRQGRRMADEVGRRHRPSRYVSGLLAVAQKALDQRTATACRRFAHRTAPHLEWLPAAARPPVRQRISLFLDQLSTPPDRQCQSNRLESSPRQLIRALERLQAERQQREQRLDALAADSRRLLAPPGPDHRPRDDDPATGRFETRRFEGLLRSLEGETGQRREQLTVFGPQIVETASRFPAGLCLDLRCRGGEWLSLVRDHGLSLLGIDDDHELVAAAQNQGLNCHVGEAMEWLRRQADESVALVTAFHTLERCRHWPQVIQILDHTFRVLRPGGLAIFETANIENIGVAGCQLHRHPQALLPLHPAALVAAVSSSGFRPPRVLRLTHGRRLEEPFDLNEPAPAGADPGDWLKLMRLLNSHLLSAPDVALVARKPLDWNSQADSARAGNNLGP